MPLNIELKTSIKFLILSKFFAYNKSKKAFLFLTELNEK